MAKRKLHAVKKTPAPSALAGALSAALTPEAQTEEERAQTQAEMVEAAKANGVLFYSSDLDPMLMAMDEVLVHLYRLRGSVAGHCWKPADAAETLRLGMLASMINAVSSHIGTALTGILSPEQMRDLVNANPQVVQGLVAAYGPEVDSLAQRVAVRAAQRVGN